METIYDVISFKEKKNSKEIFPKIIHENFGKMTNEEKFYFMKSNITTEEIDKILLTIDLNYYSQKKKEFNKYTFINEVKKLLNHYLILGKYFFEDYEWILYEPDNEIYELHINEVILENTMLLINCYNEEVINFMKQIVRQCNEMSNFKMFFNILPDKEYNLCRAIFIIQF